MSSVRERSFLMFAGTIGTTLEWYDFFVFAACAVLVFDKQFFSTSDPNVALLLSLGTFTAGFVARPFGGILLGVYGDRFGRKRALVVSLLVMGAATFAMGLLPTYATAGVLASLMLLTLRIVQGMAVGGEATGALLMVAETMPSRQRGFWTSFTMVSGPLANVIAAGVIAGVQGMYGERGFVEWGWRIPFLLSALLVILGYLTRRRLQESTSFARLAQERKQVAKTPLREALTTCRASMLKVFLTKASENTFLYLFSTFLLLLATKFLGFSRGQALNALLYASMAEVPIMLVAAALSDRVGRKPVMIVGLIGCIGAGFGLFTLVPGTSVMSLRVAILVCLAFHGCVAGAMGAYFSELFPTRVRYTGLSASYQLASVFGGSIAPLVGTVLLERTGASVSIGFYAALIAIPALASVLLSRETYMVNFEEQERETEEMLAQTQTFSCDPAFAQIPSPDNGR